MKWRWLICDYTDPELPLTRRERWRTTLALSRLHKTTWREGVLALVTSLPLLIAFVAALLFRRQLGSSMGERFFLLAIITCGLLAFLTSLYGSRWLYASSMRRAVRELGYDVCQRCGYWLRGLGDDVQNCPECGAQRRPMPLEPLP